MYSITGRSAAVYMIDLSELAHQRVCGVGTCEVTAQELP